MEIEVVGLGDGSKIHDEFYLKLLLWQKKTCNELLLK
jgi:hypothetical protein